MGLWLIPEVMRKGDWAVKAAKARYAYINPKNIVAIGLEPQILLLAFALYGSSILLADPALASLSGIMTPPHSSSDRDGCGG